MTWGGLGVMACVVRCLLPLFDSMQLGVVLVGWGVMASAFCLLAMFVPACRAARSVSCSGHVLQPAPPPPAPLLATLPLHVSMVCLAVPHTPLSPCRHALQAIAASFNATVSALYVSLQSKTLQQYDQAPYLRQLCLRLDFNSYIDSRRMNFFSAAKNSQRQLRAGHL